MGRKVDEQHFVILYSLNHPLDQFSQYVVISACLYVCLLPETVWHGDLSFRIMGTWEIPPPWTTKYKYFRYNMDNFPINQKCLLVIQADLRLCEVDVLNVLDI